MASTRLTWNQIAAPDFSSAASIYNAASQNWGQAMDGLGEAFSGVQDIKEQNAYNKALPILTKVANEQGVDSALDQAMSIVPAHLRGDAFNTAVENLRKNALGYETTRASNKVALDGNQRAWNQDARYQEDHDRSIRKEDQLAGMTGAYARNMDRALRLGGVTSPAQGSSNIRTGNATIDGMSDEELLAATIAAEAGNQGASGKQAVASVILNRASAGGKYGDGVRGVITKDGQFSWLNGVTGYANGEQGQDPTKVKYSDEDLAIARQALSGDWEDVTNGATHYYNDQVSTPKWGASAGGDWVRVGDHIFGAPEGRVTASSAAPGTSAGMNLGLSQYIPQEGNLITPSDYKALADDMYEARGKGDTYAETEYERQVQEAAARLVDEQVRTGSDPNAFVSNIYNDTSIPLDVRKAATGLLGSMDPSTVAAQRYRPVEEVVTDPSAVPAATTEQLSALQTATNNHAALAADAAANDTSARILRNAQEKYAVDDPTVALSSAMAGKYPGLAGYDTADWANWIDKVVQRTGKSKAVAAAALEESAEGRSWFGQVFHGDDKHMVVDVDKAVDLVNKNLSEESIQSATERMTLRQQQKDALAQGWGQVQALTERAQALNSSGRANPDELAKVNEALSKATQAYETLLKGSEVIGTPGVNTPQQREEQQLRGDRARAYANRNNGMTLNTSRNIQNTPQSQAAANMRIQAKSIAVEKVTNIPMHQIPQLPPQQQQIVLEQIMLALNEPNIPDSDKALLLEAVQDIQGLSAK